MARRLKSLCGCLWLALACNSSQPDQPAVPKPDAAPAQAETAKADAVADPGASGSDLDALTEWLDPDAVGVAWIDLDPKLSAATLGVVFALPPRAAELLTLPTEVRNGLEAIVDPDAERPSTWFRGPSLVTLSRLSSAPYLVRRLALPRAEIAKRLEANEFESTVIEGITMWNPTGPFGWKIAMLTDDVVAFIPVREPGSGLTPLTAGRDMPPTELETQLKKVVGENPAMKASLYTAGPMLHFDFDPSLLGARLELQAWAEGGAGALDGRVLFEPERDAGDVVTALEAREPIGENEQVRQLAQDVAYALDNELVLGRLQIPATKIAIVSEAP